ncbi:hypothetical protein [Flammeovirga pectinis]|uniref:hypothetical protein n=1 Tax=Flammeovirga pectinis TaxID=2494373 RepID=UPI0012D779FC|nr:hypothetical protein [Flammeovirga pectinis]
MQTINFKDTLNDQNVSTFVSSQKETHKLELVESAKVVVDYGWTVKSYKLISNVVKV